MDGSAVCAQTDPDLWHPARGRGGQSRAARALCASCPLLDPCRVYALGDPDLTGVWGGLTAAQRARLRAPAGRAVAGTR